MNQLLGKLRHARNRGVPLVAIEAADPSGAIADILAMAGEAPCMRWDIASGTIGLNQAGKDIAGVLSGREEFQGVDFTNGQDGLVRLLNNSKSAQHLANRWSIVLLNAHRCISDPAVSQAIWNLRDLCKSHGCMLVMIGSSFRFGPELANDVLVIDQPLPSSDDLIAMAAQCAADAKLQITDFGALADATLGLTAFAADQSLALAATKHGIDPAAVWERKRKQIEQTPGLTIWRGGETFEDVGGVKNAKTYLRSILNGARKPRGVVFVDEIEKSLAGAKGDTSGVTQDMLGVVLAHMQDTSAAGLIFLGPPGSSKSLLAKAAGNEAGIPTIKLDFGSMKDSLVGASEARIRDALKVVNAVTGGEAVWIATCNSIAELPPELRRRFTLGTFFFDLPTAAERTKIWSIWHSKLHGRKPTADDLKLRVAESEGWTGAEIRQCCEIEYRCVMTFNEARAFVVPLCVSARQQIDDLRNMANGRFLSANAEGIFRKADHVIAAKRSMSLDTE